MLDNRGVKDTEGLERRLARDRRAPEPSDPSRCLLTGVCTAGPY